MALPYAESQVARGAEVAEEDAVGVAVGAKVEDVGGGVEFGELRSEAREDDVRVL